MLFLKIGIVQLSLYYTPNLNHEKIYNFNNFFRINDNNNFSKIFIYKMLKILIFGKFTFLIYINNSIRQT